VKFANYRTNLKLILAFLSRKDKIKLVLLLLSNLVLAALDLLGVAALGILTAIAVQGAQSMSPGNKVSTILEMLRIENLNFQSKIVLLSTASLVLFIVKTLLSSLITQRTLYFLGYRSAAVSSLLSKRLLQERVGFVESKSTQELTYGVNVGASYSVLGVLGNLTKFGSDIILISVLAGGLLIVDWKTALATFTIFGITGKLLTHFFYKQATELGLKYAKNIIEGNQFTINSIDSIKEISIRGTTDYFSKSISEQRYALSAIESKSAFLGTLSKYIFEVVVVLSAFVVSAIQLSMNSPSRGAAVIAIFLASISRAAPAALRAQQTVTQLQNYFAKIQPTLELMERFIKYPTNSRSDKVRQEFNYPDSMVDISLKEVSFSYEKSPGFKFTDINLQINQGDFVAIIGPSGAGKSTLIDLILGVLQPQKGAVEIGGCKPEEITAQYPGIIGFMPQESRILPDTIKHNIDLGFANGEASEDYYYNSLRLAHLSDFVSSLPNKLMEKLGDNGFGLSGGQKQRLGIARAVFTNPRILILDEATNALDSETEAALMESINDLAQNRTLIVIAHNLSTIINASKFVFVDNGKITVAGNLEELKNSIPKFENIANLQGL
jgi:ATP-binding cassette subfamily C protein